jgi:hypothetical protein
VYERDAALVGCLRRSGGRTKLAVRVDDEDVFAYGAWGHIVLRGAFVAYRWHFELSGQVTDSLRVVHLRSGSRRSTPYAPPLRALLLSATGGLAYLSDDGLWAADGGGVRRLAGPDVDRSSISLSGSTLRWPGGEALVAGGTTCEPRLAPSLAWDDVGRAYDLGPSGSRVLYACLWARSRRIRLSAAPHAQVEIAGRFVAWTEAGIVVVRDLIRGREVRPAAGTVLELAVGGDGLVAWAQPGRILATRGTIALEVGTGDVDPGSLVVRSGTVLWRQDGVERSAPVRTASRSRTT